jgi:glutamate dehydrogenase (NAD(P)+)
MEAFLKERLPERTWQNRLDRDHGRCYLEFTTLDVDRLTRLGINVDSLGPRLVVCMWDEKSPLEIGGYLVIDNLAMGSPSMGGIRMMPDITPAGVYNLARGMTLKNAAANLPFGGGKCGIVTDRQLTAEAHSQVISGFARLLQRYKNIYLPGPDVGTNDEDMKTVAIENGLDCAVSKTVEMGGNQIDQLGAAAGGLVIALQALLEEMPRLRSLPQFAGLQLPSQDELTVIIQGFGAVGAHTACILQQRIPGVKVVGASDIKGYLYNHDGLPVNQLFRTWQEYGTITHNYYQQHLLTPEGLILPTKYSTAADDLLRESAFCLIPAAPIANYLDTDDSTHPTMTVDRMGNWAVIIEGANTYSPDPSRRAARARMERAVYRQRGVLIATDYLVNSGGVIFAAQEQLIRTPDHLRIPEAMFGNREAVDQWLDAHADELAQLAGKRRQAAETAREEIIRRNMRELVDTLLLDADMLPCEAAERISIRRIASSERDRKAAEIMLPMPTIPVGSTVQQAANLLVETGSPILAVLSESGELAGVVTDWDITRATAEDLPNDEPLGKIMSQEVISANPADNLVEVIRKLEYHEISAMPVVEQGCVSGMVTADLLARRSLLRLLQSQSA